jgi:cobalt/nickel transport system permease protein
VHIPDGYLSPSTCAAFYAAATPVWVTAGRRVRKVVKNRYVPLVAIGAAYSFLVMMFNVPIPDGTTAHAVGAVLIAVLLGPWAAVIAVSIALLIQALFFGDGGVLVYGANVFNMAFVMPMAGYAVYRALSRTAPLTSGRRAFAAGVAGYVGLNAAALCAAIEFGLQPTLFHAADGTPLYAPFHLAQTIPTMALAHLTVAGLVEAVLTAGVVAYLQRANLPIMRINHPGHQGHQGHPDVPRDTDNEDDTEAAGRAAVAARRMGWRWALIGLGVMVVLTPLGLLAPGGAFGEDAPADLNVHRYGLRAIPQGLNRYYGFWRHTVLGGYGFSSGEHPVVSYILSAVIGIAVIALASFLVFKLFLPGSARTRTRRRGHHPAGQAGAVRLGGVSGSATRTPDWLVQSEAGLCPCGCIGKRRKGSFVDKTINGSARILRQAMFSEDVAARRGVLQRIDPRVKVVTLIGLLLVAALVRHIPVLAAMYLGTVALAAASGLSLGFFVKRVWLFIPIFTGIVVLPATLNFVTHGDIVVPLGHWFGHEAGLTAQGLRSAGLIVMRVATSISLVVLITLTTPWSRLLAALRALFVPRMFILVLGMAYRYVFHLLNAVTDMYTARKARTVGRDTDVTTGRRFVAASAGALFGKAYALSDEVHMAMVSRGYRGNVRTISRQRIGPLDVGWALVCVVVAVVTLGGDRALGR